MENRESTKEEAGETVNLKYKGYADVASPVAFQLWLNSSFHQTPSSLWLSNASQTLG
jgi:hypothetical protein